MNNEKCFSRAVTVEAIVGLFVALVFIALAIFTIVVSGSSLFKNNQFEIKVVMPDAMGLRRNDTVIARGTTVGTVEEVFFDRDGVHVRAMLNAPVVFHEGYRVTVVSISILGGRQLVIHEGDSTLPVVDDVLNLRGEQPSDIMDDATAAIRYLRDFLAGDFLEHMRLTAENLTEVSDRIAHGKGTLGKLFSEDDTLYEDLRASVADIRTITARLERGESSLGKLLAADTQVYDDLAVITASFREISERLSRGEGTLGRLLSSDTGLYDNINDAVSDVREVIDDMRETSPVSTFSSFIFGAF